MAQKNFRTISIEDVRKAAAFLKGKVVQTSIRRCPAGFEPPGTEIFLKCENEQATGSFKIRGALNKMSVLTPEQKEKGVVASSAGNHAQGVALAAKAMGVAAHIVMPVTTPIVKINATRSYGAEVILEGDIYDDAYAKATTLEREKGYTFIHPYQDPDVIAGQGTIGLEIMEAMPDLDSIVIPIGGGGMMSGIATVAKALKPDIKIIGVVSNQAPGMMHLFAGEKEPAPTRKRISTIAEGIAIKSPSALMFSTYISRLVDQIVAVDDNEIAQAIVFLLEKGKTVTEGAGAAGFAAVMGNKGLELGKKSCVILCGGNIDLNVMAKVIERGLRQESRLARLAVVCDDLPGTLNRLTTVLAEHRANILEVYHDRVSPELGIRETRIDLLVETSSHEHLETIQKALKASDFKIVRS